MNEVSDNVATTQKKSSDCKKRKQKNENGPQSKKGKRNMMMT